MIPFLRVLAILLILLFADGGRSLLLVTGNVKSIAQNSHNNDLEEPHQHNSYSFSAEEKYLNTDEIVIPDIIQGQFFRKSRFEFTSGGFSQSVWQPPKKG